MKRIVVAVLCFLPTFAIAAPFDGTWVEDPSSIAWVHPEPEIYLLQDGWFTCGVGACLPTFRVPADGKPHRVIGHPSYDNVTVIVVNAHTVLTRARNGNTRDWETTDTVSEDGHTLTEDTVTHDGGKSGTSKATFNRTAAGPTGSQALSGSWLADPKSMVFSAALSTVRYQERSEGLQMSDPLGEHYDAKFDGKEYLTQGDHFHTLVSLERLGPREIRETDHSGAHLNVFTMKVAEDGKTMQVLAEDKSRGGSWKYVLRKKL